MSFSLKYLFITLFMVGKETSMILLEVAFRLRDSMITMTTSERRNNYRNLSMGMKMMSTTKTALTYSILSHTSMP
jgi:hypothetical protein